MALDGVEMIPWKSASPERRFEKFEGGEGHSGGSKKASKERLTRLTGSTRTALPDTGMACESGLERWQGSGIWMLVTTIGCLVKKIKKALDTDRTVH